MSEVLGALQSPEERERVSIHSTVANGDCLFDSVRIVLNHDTSIQVDIPYLRRVVAQSLLLPHVQATTLHHWYTLFHELSLERDGETMLHEYAFMQPARGKPWPLAPNVILQIAQAMMDRNLFWGEEFAIRVFEQQLQVRCIIVEGIPGHGLRLQHWNHDGEVEYRPTHYMCLFLQSRHYQPISYRSQFLFTPAEMPLFLQRWLRTACQKENGGWIRKNTP